MICPNSSRTESYDASFHAVPVTYSYSHGLRSGMTDASGSTGYFYSAARLQQVFKPAGTLGGFAEPELYGIGVVFTPQLAGGQDHWSCPVTEETAQSYADRFARAAKRIKEEGLNFLPNPNR